MYPHFSDIYQTPEGERPLPAEVSFTWELVARIDAFRGTNDSGILVDASRGVGRLAGFQLEDTDMAITIGLSLSAVEGDKTRFLLHFSVPIDDRNKTGTIISAELEFGKWYHLVAIYDEESRHARIYVNGEEAAWGEVLSANERATGLAIAGYGPEVIRVDHRLALSQAFIDAMAFSKGALRPEQWSLTK
jgi:hypothetical protein